VESSRDHLEGVPAPAEHRQRPRPRLPVALAVACALVPRIASAACDVALLGSLEFGSRILDVEVAGDLAYVAAGWQGLAIVHVADPADLRLIGSLDLGAYVQDVEVEGDVAWVAASDFAGLGGGLYAVAVGDPALPVLLGSVAASFSQVETDGAFAYAIDPDSGLHVVDVSTPSSPAIVAGLDLPGFESNVEVVGDLAYVTVLGGDPGFGIRIVDVSVPAAPLETAAIPGDDRLPVDVHVESGAAFVPAIGRSRRGLIVFDLEAPGGVTETAFLAQPNARTCAGWGAAPTSPSGSTRASAAVRAACG